MRITYLAQGSRARLLELPIPYGARVFHLAYDDPEPLSGAGFIHDSACTWAEGRNRLVDLAREAGPFDYLIFCDDDCRIARGSFAIFEDALRRMRPAIAIPVMPKARMHGAVLDQPVQGAVVIDEQMVAVHRSVLDTPGVCPLVTDYDPVSWYAACLIFEHEVLARFGSAVHQVNQLEIDNAVHTWTDPDASYRQGEWNDYWPLVRDWIDRNGTYRPACLEPYNGTFLTDPRRTAALARMAARRLRQAASPTAFLAATTDDERGIHQTA
jgi:hypothetical protein